MRSALTAHLRASTRAQHARLDTTLGLPHSISTRADLSHVLKALLTAWEPLEQALHAVQGWETLGLDPRLGDASHLLHDDLHALRCHSSTTPPGVMRPHFETLPAAVGARYVLLGSATGGRIVAPAIEQTLGLTPGESTRFFRRAGMFPAGDWQLFQRATNILTSPAELASALAGAHQAFDIVRVAVNPTPGAWRSP